MSIGSNDLIQYVMAAGRDVRAVADLYDPRNPAVLELIERVVAAGRRRGIEVSRCGDMASEPTLVPQLLELGLRRLSVAPTSLGAVKAAIASWRRTGPGAVSEAARGARAPHAKKDAAITQLEVRR